MLNEVTRWVLCLPDNSMVRCEEQVPMSSVQLSSNSRLRRDKWRILKINLPFIKSFECVQYKTGSNKLDHNTHTHNKMAAAVLNQLDSDPLIRLELVCEASDLKYNTSQN
jgi:hypothetical protein